MAKWISENLGPSLDMAGFGELKVMMYDDQRDMVEEWVKEVGTIRSWQEPTQS